MAVNREVLMESIRIARDDKLSRSDIEMLRIVESATSFSALVAQRADWVTYRQSLRDYPSTIPDPVSDDLSDLPPITLSPTEQAAVDAAELNSTTE